MPSPTLKKLYSTEDVMALYHLQKHLKDAKYHYECAKQLALQIKDQELQKKAARLLRGEEAP